MMSVLLILWLLTFILLVGVTAVTPEKTTHSLFELKRRQATGDEGAVAILRRETLLPDVISIFRVASALTLVLLVALSVTVFGWLVGVLLALVVALEYGAVSRLSFVQRQANRLYKQYEQSLLNFVEKHGRFLQVLRHHGLRIDQEQSLESREELLHLVQTSQGVVSSDEKKLIVNGLQFGDREVREVMTPRGIIDSIAKNELLGPLVLDDLHKTGHSRFPVIDEDVDHVVGMLHIQNLFTLGNKRSVTAEKAMEPRVFYIREDQTLQHALAAFLRTHHHLFVVVNEFRETVGLLSLEDVIEALLGRKIIDEFDAHDDLRAVAKRNPRGNNHPKGREDV